MAPASPSRGVSQAGESARCVSLSDSRVRLNLTTVCATGFNVNRGRKIALRLRQPHNEDDFIDEESITETMLHELAHNVRGPHDDEFFRVLDGLTMEWYDLRFRQRFGLTGTGLDVFQSHGFKLGEGSVDPRDARARAADMAEKRWRLQQAMGNSGRAQTLGSASSRNAGKSKAQLAAEAAERRTSMSKSCPSTNISLIEDADREQEAQERLHGIEVITIQEDDDDGGHDGDEHRHNRKRPIDNVGALDKGGASGQKVTKREEDNEDDDDIVFVGSSRLISHPRPSPQRTPSSRTTNGALVRQTRAAAALRFDNLQRTDTNTSSLSTTAPSSSDLDTQSARWTCQACTLVNGKTSLTCEACETIRPGLPCWTCLGCGHRMMGDDARFWCCIKCGVVKASSGPGES